REIQQLLGSAPIAVSVHSAASAANPTASPDANTVNAGVLLLPSVPVDEILDDHATEFEECKRWANSEAGQAAHMTNPAGFANVRAHAEAHLRAMQQLA